MQKNKLGIPLKYTKLPEYYDAFNTPEKNIVIEKLLREQKVETVLDLTCGTGSQVFFLIKHGYKVTGADFSPALLNVARDKARKEGIDVSLIEGDMRNIQVGQFDSVITIANAIGHLTRTDFEKAIRNIHQNLKDGGIYVFDIFNLTSMTDMIVADHATHWKTRDNNSQAYVIRFSTLNRERGLFTWYDTYIIQKNLEAPKTFKSKFTLQIYTAKEIREILNKNGFETIEQYGIDGSKFSDDATLHMLTVAKKRN
jgi:ubiquinone/menaquinone biosynthesis C-methylase UbiE